ncbi:MAG: hypothetical protein FWG57_00395, partial [Endomicrobia bacterium]|nr:hypothetical protein [Endomicrobiia bacterium]
MNRKILTLSLLSFALLFTASLSFAAFPGEKTSKVKAAVRFTPNVTVNHRHVMRISPFQHEVNFVVRGSYGNPSVTHMAVEYYINNDTSTTTTLTLEAIPTPLDEISTSFQSSELTVPSHAASFSYRFVAVVDNNHADKKYYPYISNTWIHVPVLDYSTQTIGISGGSIILDSGDQRYGYSEMLIRPDSLSGDRLIQMKECDINSLGATPDLVKLYEISTQQTLSKAAQITLYYGSSNEGKYIVKYLDGTSWKKINLSKPQDTLNKTVTFEAASFGQYGIFIEVSAPPPPYRPEYRVFKFGEKLKFGDLLQAGDVVTIFDINGRRIRRLTEPPFEWDGRKDNGSYAESGSYIYQIKVDG